MQGVLKTTFDPENRSIQIAISINTTSLTTPNKAKIVQSYSHLKH